MFFWSFLAKVFLYIKMQNFKQAKVSKLDTGFLHQISSKFVKVFRFWLRDRKKIRANREEFKQKEAKLNEVIKEWVLRLQDNDFHGGKFPDAADFKMYSLFSDKTHVPKLRKVIENNKGSTKFSVWIRKMQSACYGSLF